MLKNTYCGWFDFLEERFYETITDLKKSDPLMNIFVVAPSNVLRDRLIQLLTKRGLFALNIHFHNFHSLVLSILEFNRIEKRAEPYDFLYRVMCEKNAERILKNSQHRYAKGMGFPLYETIKDLRDACVEPESLLEEEFDKLQGDLKNESTISFEEIAALYMEFCSALQNSGMLDPAGETLLAVSAEGSSDSRFCDTLLFYGFYDLIGLNLDLVNILMRKYDSYLFFPYSEDFFLKGAKQLLDSFYALNEKKPARSPIEAKAGIVEKIIDASGTDNEIRAVAKEILRLHDEEEIDFDDIAVVSRNGDSAGRIIAIFNEEMIPVRGCHEVEGRELPLVASFLRLIDIREAGYPAKHFLDLFSSAFFKFPNPLFHGKAVALLESYFSNRGITGGSQWKALDPSSDIKLKGSFSGDKTEVIRCCVELIKQIIADTESIPDSASPSTFSSTYLELLKKYFSIPDDPVMTQIDERITFLAKIDRITAVIGRRDFLELLRRFLLEISTSSGSFRNRGVFTGSAMQIRGLCFNVLFLIQMNDGIFPRKVSQDPFLSDQARGMINSIGYKLDLKLAGRLEERFLFDFLLRAGQRIFISYQRSDESGKQLLKSPFIANDEFKNRPAESFPRMRTGQIRKIAITKPTLLNRGELLSLLNSKDVGLLGSLLDAGTGSILARAKILTHHLNNKGDSSDYDGFVVSPEFPSARTFLNDLKANITLSYYSLLDLMSCPFRFFAGKILSGDTTDIEEKPSLDLDLLTIGSIFHKILAKWFHSKRGKSPEIDSIAKEVFAEHALDFALLPSAVVELREKEILNIASYIADYFSSQKEKAQFETEIPYKISLGSKYSEKTSLSQRENKFESPFNLDLRIDMIIKRASGAVELIDYKYSEGEEERLKRENYKNLFQLILYEIAYRLKESGIKDIPISLKLIELKRAAVASVEEAIFEYNKIQSDKAQRYMDEFLRRLALANEAFSSGSFFPVSCHLCSYCEYLSFCRKENYHTGLRLEENPLYMKFTGAREEGDDE